MTTSIVRRSLVLITLTVLAFGAVGLAGWWHPNAPQMLMQVYLPKITLGTVLVAGVIDGINPCAFTVLLLFITALLSTLKAGETNIQSTRARMVGMGSIYIGAVFVTYLALGVGLLKVATIFTRQHLPARVGALVAILMGCGCSRITFCRISAGGCKRRGELVLSPARLRKRRRCRRW